MGFGSILQVNITSYPGQLSYYLLDVYDADSKRLVLQNSVIEITEQTVHDMMGLPFGGEDINELPLCDKGNEILEEWRGQYSGDKFNGEEYLRRIQSTTKDNLMFRLNFLTLFVNNFIESMLMGRNQIKVVRKDSTIGNPFGGRQFRDEHDDVDMGDETGAEEQQMLSFKRDFGDEEAYAAVIEHSYGVILIEKSTMEVALKDGLEKFPHSVVLNE
ncbi:unnamed protein product [Lactuca saligna]|uniref:Uncharacterized protein n=1 Tax=Lactuca saligna TaxID=75948 RepID=A0AA35YYN1_LACSI|nr:unnamed protein product [Lactuca saligna]